MVEWAAGGRPVQVRSLVPRHFFQKARPNISMQILTCKSQEEAKKKSAERLGLLLSKNCKKKINTLLLLSGGSALSILEFVPQTGFGPYLTITVLDERYGSDPTVNNFAQIKSTSFYKSAKKAGVGFFETTSKVKTLASLAKDFNQFLEKWLKKNPKGSVIATIGIGEDAHTAGIVSFPDSKKEFEKLFARDKYAVSYDAKGKNAYPLRITVTLPFFKKIDHAVALVLGEKKKSALEKVVSEDHNYHETPGAVLHKIKDLQIFTDIDL